MKIVYLAGPYRADTAAEVERNIQNARRYHMALTEAGIFSFCPHVHMAHYDGLQEEQWFLDGTMEMMRRCDALVFIRGAMMKSSGSIREMHEAGKLKIPIYEISYPHRITAMQYCTGSIRESWWCNLKDFEEHVRFLPPRNKEVK